MLRSKRFRLAAALLLILLICYACRALRRRGTAAPPAPPPVQTGTQAAATTLTAAAQTAQTQTQTAPPETDAAQTSAQTAAAESAADEPEMQTPAETEPVSAAEPTLPAWKDAELREKTAQLAAELGDFAGWIFVAESEIDYPVMQGEDNFYYLDHAPDGRYLKRGTIFLDCRNARDFSDPHSILFGHNMVSGMFGDIRSFKDRQAFDRHRYGWLYTPEAVFRIDFFALAILDAHDSVYAAAFPQEEWISHIRTNALHDTGAEILPADRLIALSTCAYASGDDRALFTGRLLRMTADDYISS